MSHTILIADDSLFIREALTKPAQADCPTHSVPSISMQFFRPIDPS